MVMLAGFTDMFVWWQGVLVILLILLVVFWKVYRNKQM